MSRARGLVGKFAGLKGEWNFPVIKFCLLSTFGRLMLVLVAACVLLLAICFPRAAKQRICEAAKHGRGFAALQILDFDVFAKQRNQFVAEG